MVDRDISIYIKRKRERPPSSPNVSSRTRDMREREERGGQHHLHGEPETAMRGCFAKFASLQGVSI